ncbi:hypothetical protein [Lysobacter capsici]|uniref:hypothetical protein n=1 Tax=Lysobacter capsici TaxID=435897 RepID=UPI001C002A44|nr:hypothetical protein [Lysobacter capsici]QWF17015.1 hypothetical protein KME82_25350 [Lysobacter capsici]
MPGVVAHCDEWSVRSQAAMPVTKLPTNTAGIAAFRRRRGRYFSTQPLGCHSYKEKFMNARNMMYGAVALISLVAMGASMTSSAQGPKRLELHYYYYSDAAHTVRVGEEWLKCNGQHTMDGVYSEYYALTSRVCP